MTQTMSALGSVLESQRMAQTLKLLTEANREISGLRQQIVGLQQELADLKRQQPIRSSEPAFTLRCGAIVDPESRTVVNNQRGAHLTEQEWRIMAYLRDAQRAVPRDELLQYLYQGSCSVSASTTHLSRLRAKLRTVGAEDDITNNGQPITPARRRGQARYVLHLEARS